MAQDVLNEAIPPTPQKRRERIGRLITPGQIRTEIARLYRQAKWNEIDVSRASKLASILQVGLTAAKMEQESEQEKRLDAIEAALTPNNVVPFRRSS